MPDIFGQPFRARVTYYAPGPGDRMEGPFATSRPNKQGQLTPFTLDDVRLGRSDYVTVASDPSRYGQTVNLGDRTYRSPLDNQTYTLPNVQGYVHDTGSAFRGRPDKLDVAVGDFRGWSPAAASNFVRQDAGTIDVTASGGDGGDMPTNASLTQGRTMPSLTDMMQPQQNTFQSGMNNLTSGGMSNSLIGLGMGMLQPYRPWAGESPWSNALKGYMAGASGDREAASQRQNQQLQLYDRQWREQQAAQAQANADRAFSEQRRQFDLTKGDQDWRPGEYTVPETSNEPARKIPYQINPKTGEVRWPFGKPPGVGGDGGGGAGTTAAPTGRTTVVPDTTLYWPSQQQDTAPPATTGAGAAPISPPSAPATSASAPATSAGPAAGVSELPPGSENWPYSQKQEYLKKLNAEKATLAAKSAAADPERKRLAAETKATITDAGSRAMNLIENNPNLTTGLIGGLGAKFYPQGPAGQLQGLLNTIKSNLTFDKLQAVRQSSPTGAAVGNVSDKDMAELKTSMGDLEQSRDPETLKYNLERVMRKYYDIENGPGAADKNLGASRYKPPAGQQAPGAAPTGRTGGAQKWGRDADGNPVMLSP